MFEGVISNEQITQIQIVSLIALFTENISWRWIDPWRHFLSLKLCLRNTYEDVESLTICLTGLRQCREDYCDQLYKKSQDNAPTMYEYMFPTFRYHAGPHHCVGLQERLWSMAFAATI